MSEIIKLQSLEGQIEESGGRRKFIIPMEKKIMYFEKRMLYDGECPYILPIRFLNKNGKEEIYYDFTGYIQLKEYIKNITINEISAAAGNNAVCSALNVISGILTCIKGLENYLIFSDRITIHTDFVFIHPDAGLVLMAFYPNDCHDLTLQSRIIMMIEDLVLLYRTDEVTQYLLVLKDFIERKNPGLDGIRGYLGMMQREISYAFGSNKDFRREENKEGICEHEQIENNNTSNVNAPGTNFSERTRFLSNKKIMKSMYLQLILVTGLAVLYMSGIFDAMEFIGLVVLAAGADLWLIRKLYAVK